jgi:hypothetical protein
MKYGQLVKKAPQYSSRLARISFRLTLWRAPKEGDMALTKIMRHGNPLSLEPLDIGLFKIIKLCKFCNFARLCQLTLKDLVTFETLLAQTDQAIEMRIRILFN